MLATNGITEGRRYRIIYHTTTPNEITERVIDCKKVYRGVNGDLLVIAYCHRRGATRTFSAANILFAMEDESTAIASFGMHAAVTNGDAEAFHRFYEDMRVA